MNNPIKCDCGYWDRDRPHSRLGGGGACKYSSLRKEDERLRKLATQRGARMQKLWHELQCAESLDKTELALRNLARLFDDDGVPVE